MNKLFYVGCPVYTYLWDADETAFLCGLTKSGYMDQWSVTCALELYGPLATAFATETMPGTNVLAY